MDSLLKSLPPNSQNQLKKHDESFLLMLPPKKQIKDLVAVPYKFL